MNSTEQRNKAIDLLQQTDVEIGQLCGLTELAQFQSVLYPAFEIVCFGREQRNSRIFAGCVDTPFRPAKTIYLHLEDRHYSLLLTPSRVLKQCSYYCKG